MSQHHKSMMIRQACQVTAKRIEIFGNKKPGIAPGFYTFRAAGAPQSAPVAKPNTPRAEVLSYEFCPSE